MTARDADGTLRALVEAFKAAEKLRSMMYEVEAGKKAEVKKKLEEHEFTAEQAGIALVAALLTDVGRIADALEIIAGGSA